MDAKSRRSRLNLQIYQEACGWLVEFRSGEPGWPARQEFDLWLRKSPEHVAAYLEAAALWEEGPALDPRRTWDADALIANAMAEPDNVTQMGLRSKIDAVTGPDSGRRLRTGTMFALAALLLCAIGGAIATWMSGDTRVSTGVGEQRSLVLDDGSTVSLDSRSSILVSFTREQRRVNLVSGQALFHVAGDPARPFIVNAGATRVQAIGTEFDVYRKPSATVVTVMEGRVAVSQGTEDANTPAGRPIGYVQPHPHEVVALAPRGAERGTSKPILLSAGEQVTVAPHGVEKTPAPNLAGATAWTQRKLVFESAPIAAVAEEFNRYNVRPLVVENAAAFDFHISGAFSSTDPAPLVRFLRNRPDVTVTQSATEIRIAKKSGR
jgi:transmembrane sensor